MTLLRLSLTLVLLWVGMMQHWGCKLESQRYLAHFLLELLAYPSYGFPCYSYISLGPYRLFYLQERIPDVVVSIVLRLRTGPSRVRIPTGKIKFFCFLIPSDMPRNQTSVIFNRDFFLGQSDRSVNVVTCHQVPSLRMSGADLHSPYMPFGRGQGRLLSLILPVLVDSHMSFRASCSVWTVDSRKPVKGRPSIVSK